MVRCLISISRTSSMSAVACCASVLIATNRIDGRLTASQITAAAAEAKHVTGERILPEHCLGLPPGDRTPYACRWRPPLAIPGFPPADRSSQQFDHLPQRLRADAHPCPTPKPHLDDALAIRPPQPTVIRSTAIRRDLDRHHGAAFDHCFRQQLPPPSEQLVAVHIMTSRHDRHRRPPRPRLRHQLALQRFRILSTLRRARPPLSVH
jgi:hypothetical protein